MSGPNLVLAPNVWGEDPNNPPFPPQKKNQKKKSKNLIFVC